MGKLKKIINNKVYDTATARVIGYASKEGVPTAALHQKRTGEYFTHHLTDTGTDIKPLTSDEAKTWAKDNLPEEVYAMAFGEVDTGEKAALYAEIDASLLRMARTAAFNTGTTLTAWVEEAIRRAL